MFKQQSGKKAVIALTCLLLFIPQLSYKFYLAANVPSVYFTGRQLTHLQKDVSGVQRNSLSYDRHHRLRIDKRYVLKLVFVLPSLILAGSNVYGWPCLAFGQISSRLSLSFYYHRLVRGPPAAAFLFA